MKGTLLRLQIYTARSSIKLKFVHVFANGSGQTECCDLAGPCQSPAKVESSYKACIKKLFNLENEG